VAIGFKIDQKMPENEDIGENYWFSGRANYRFPMKPGGVARGQLCIIATANGPALSTKHPFTHSNPFF
jgi:hypothetical protein